MKGLKLNSEYCIKFAPHPHLPVPKISIQCLLVL